MAEQLALDLADVIVGEDDTSEVPVLSLSSGTPSLSRSTITGESELEVLEASLQQSMRAISELLHDVHGASSADTDESAHRVQAAIDVLSQSIRTSKQLLYYSLRTMKMCQYNTRQERSQQPQCCQPKYTMNKGSNTPYVRAECPYQKAKIAYVQRLAEIAEFNFRALLAASAMVAQLQSRAYPPANPQYCPPYAYRPAPPPPMYRFVSPFANFRFY